MRVLRAGREWDQAGVWTQVLYEFLTLARYPPVIVAFIFAEDRIDACSETFPKEMNTCRTCGEGSVAPMYVIQEQ